MCVSTALVSWHMAVVMIALVTSDVWRSGLGGSGECGFYWELRDGRGGEHRQQGPRVVGPQRDTVQEGV